MLSILLITLLSNQFLCAQETSTDSTSTNTQQYFSSELKKINDSTYLVHINLIKKSNLIFAEHKGFKIENILLRDKVSSISLLNDDLRIQLSHEKLLTSTQKEVISDQSDVIMSKDNDIHTLQQINKSLRRKQIVPWLITAAATVVTILSITK